MNEPTHRVATYQVIVDLPVNEDDDPVRQPPFDAISFPLASLWA
jgi:hypothetical protein